MQPSSIRIFGTEFPRAWLRKTLVCTNRSASMGGYITSIAASAVAAMVMFTARKRMAFRVR